MMLDANATYLLNNALAVPEASIEIYSEVDPKQFIGSFVSWDHEDGHRLKISEIVGKDRVKTDKWEEDKKSGINFHKDKFKTCGCATFTLIAVRKPGFPYLVIDGNKRLIALLEVLNEDPSSIKHMDVRAILIESPKMEQMANDDYEKVLKSISK